MYGDGDLSEREGTFFTACSSSSSRTRRRQQLQPQLDVHKSVHGRRRAVADRPFMYVIRLQRGCAKHSEHFNVPGVQLEENLNTI